MTRILKGTFVPVHLVSCRPHIGDQTETQIGDYPTKPREVKLVIANRPFDHGFVLTPEEHGQRKCILVFAC